jgi:hypothetical protein
MASYDKNDIVRIHSAACFRWLLLPGLAASVPYGFVVVFLFD